MWVFYTPIFFWTVLLAARYRGLAFLSVNPGFPMSGLFGEQKATSLSYLQGLDELAKFALVLPDEDIDRRLNNSIAKINELSLSYPIVLKPDVGQRGADVAIVRSMEQLREYLLNVSGTLVLQEYVGGEEFGIFYMRNPRREKGGVFSITEKTFPVLVGDGVATIEELMMRNPRTHYMAEYLLKLHADKLDRVLGFDEKFKVVEIGSHCRGSVFLDGASQITAELDSAMDRISAKIPGFYFGRYDIRVPDKESLRNGAQLKVLEVNGVTSESTNIYDPKYSVFTAYKIMFAQWFFAFKIGQENIKLGAQKVSIAQFIAYLFQERKETVEAAPATQAEV
ncbi:MAG: carboxylate--amine ligase [Pseudomonadota bacterium]